MSGIEDLLNILKGKLPNHIKIANVVKGDMDVGFKLSVFVDSNNDNRLDSEELVSLFNRLKDYDANNNSKLDKKELETLLQDIRETPYGRTIDEIQDLERIASLLVREIKKNPVQKDVTPASYTPEELHSLLTEDKINEKTNDILQACSSSKEFADIIDNYYDRYGEDVTDTIINNSTLSEKQKKDLLKSFCGKYKDAKSWKHQIPPRVYSAFKEIDNSKIKSEYYEGDDYSVSFKGPVVVVTNNDKQITSRINLEKLTSNFIDDVDFLATLQRLPGEILENIYYEIERVEVMDNNIHIATACYWDKGIQMKTYSTGYEYTLIHEICHAIDDIENPSKFSDGKFYEKYDEYYEQYHNSWYSRGGGAGEWKIFVVGNDYAASNQEEGFAVALSAVFGVKNDHTKFVKKYMPELIDIARDMYVNYANDRLVKRKATESQIEEATLPSSLEYENTEEVNSSAEHIINRDDVQE